MLSCISIDYRAAGIQLLERIQRHAAAAEAAFGSLGASGIAKGHVILATCNRYEVYLDAEQDPTAEATLALSLATGIEPQELEDAARILHDDRAAEHLFSVASGLKSAVIGEEEIAGQVRKAHDRARNTGALSNLLERLFQGATRTSRRVKHLTGIQSKGRSLVRLGLLLSERRLPAWDEARVLLVGTGAYAGATAAALKARGAQRVVIHSPSGRAEDFADAHGFEAVVPEGLPEALAEADLIVACSRATDPFITREGVLEALRASSRPRLFLDLGVPRNIDPAVGEIDEVELIDIETIAKHSSVAELSAESEARDIVQRSAQEFISLQAELSAVPTLVALRDHVFQILEEELCRNRKDSCRASSGELPACATEVILRRFAGRMLHEPSVRLRSLGREGRADEASAALSAIFGVQGR